MENTEMFLLDTFSTHRGPHDKKVCVGHLNQPMMTITFNNKTLYYISFRNAVAHTKPHPENGVRRHDLAIKVEIFVKPLAKKDNDGLVKSGAGFTQDCNRG